MEGVETRLNRLDHLRFVAAALVVIWHFGGSLVPANAPMQYPLMSILQQGHTGVALFCVLSGFLFTWLYYDKKIDVRSFAKKRALRILPMFVLAVVLAFYTAPGSDPSKVLLGILSTLPDAGTFPGFSAVCWTILVEIQFYAVFPLLVLFSRRYGWHYLIGLIAFLLCIRGVTWFNAPTSINRVAYWSIIGRLDQFLFGMLAAILFRKLLPLHRISRACLFISGIAGAAALLSFYEMFNRVGGFYTPNILNGPLWIVIPSIEGASYAAILLGYLAIPRVPFAKAADAVFSHGGKVSYSMYLTHAMMLPLIAYSIRKAGISVTSFEGNLKAVICIVLPVLVGIASAAYYLIEKPMMELGAKPKGERQSADVIYQGRAGMRSIGYGVTP